MSARATDEQLSHVADAFRRVLERRHPGRIITVDIVREPEAHDRRHPSRTRQITRPLTTPADMQPLADRPAAAA